MDEKLNWYFLHILCKYVTSSVEDKAVAKLLCQVAAKINISIRFVSHSEKFAFDLRLTLSSGYSKTNACSGLSFPDLYQPS